MWRRYRFRTKSVDDERPIIFNRAYPWWCSGYGLGGTINEPGYDSAIIIAFLPSNEDLKKYWPDAYEVEYTEHETIEFSDRFPKPSYYEELNSK
jgi:hypothetical protein